MWIQLGWGTDNGGGGGGGGGMPIGRVKDVSRHMLKVGANSKYISAGSIHIPY